MLADFKRDELYRKSVEIILENQDQGGGYIASPNFPTYHFCWFRDGAFIAYAMDLAGEQESADRFHDWAARQINRREDIVEKALRKSQAGEALSGEDYLHTRYTLEGQEDSGEVEEWPNFQLDGFGTWLWALEEHCRRRAEPAPEPWIRAADLTSRYLEGLWEMPCWDCWEEFQEHVHPSTLAAIYAGLEAHTRLSGRDHRTTLAAIRDRLEREFVYEGKFVKFPGDKAVDANLLSLAVPYGVFMPEDARMRGTAAAIEETLVKGGGVHRYARDSYYGGGEWILLSAWLAWYYACLGDAESRQKAEGHLAWIRSQADEKGWLPEQTAKSLNDPAYLEPWVQQRGPVANPLLWSQAKYIILMENLR
jgi:GH15 family glucan-1,4-alpha-glucosidase